MICLNDVHTFYDIYVAHHRAWMCVLHKFIEWLGPIHTFLIYELIALVSTTLLYSDLFRNEDKLDQCELNTGRYTEMSLFTTKKLFKKKHFDLLLIYISI